MTQNIGGIERIIRVLAGLILVGLILSGQIGVWGWLGLVPISTGLIGWCPLYSLLGIDTCNTKH